MNDTITAVPGIEAGHYTDLANGTGCTVVLCRDGAAGGVDVRGGSPGTRETNLLEPARRVDRVFAVVLSGGSAFGLDAASGVMAYLEEQGIGFKTAGGVVVPIVSSAILYDLGVITSKVRPGPEQGRAACDAAGPGPLEEGTVGAGTGATVAKTGGTDRALKGGIGSAALVLPSGHVVGATVAVNAIGGIWDYADGSVLAGPRRTGGGFEDPVEALFRSSAPSPSGEHENTSIGVVATDAKLNREEANYLARVSHDGLALTIRPCHTIRDGDTMFAMATGGNSAPVDIAVLGAAAVEVTARAVLRGIRSAAGLGGFPSAAEWAVAVA